VACLAVMSSESATGLGDIDQRGCSSVMNGQYQPEGDSADSDFERRMRSKPASIRISEKSFPTMGDRCFSKTKRLSICCLIENKCFAIMLLRIWLYFCFPRVSAFPASARSLPNHLPHCLRINRKRCRQRVFWDAALGIGFGKALVRSPVLCTRQCPGFFEILSIRRVDKRVKGNR